MKQLIEKQFNSGVKETERIIGKGILVKDINNLVDIADSKRTKEEVALIGQASYLAGVFGTLVNEIPEKINQDNIITSMMTRIMTERLEIIVNEMSQGEQVYKEIMGRMRTLSPKAYDAFLELGSNGSNYVKVELQ